MAALRLPSTLGLQDVRSGARGGQLGTLVWLRSQAPPCPWNERVAEEEAAACQLTVLKWLLAQSPPCPISRKQCRRAAMHPPARSVQSWARGSPQRVALCAWLRRVRVRGEPGGAVEGTCTVFTLSYDMGPKMRTEAE